MRRFFVAFGCFGFIADRLLKWYAQSLPDGTVFALFPGLQFGYFLNPALFFFPAWRFIPYLALIVLIALIATVVYRRQSSLYPSPYTLIPIILGGGSNAFDRFTYGGVIDYVYILGIATINIADILILTGMLFLIFKHYDQRN